MSNAPEKQRKRPRRHAWLYALPEGELPATVQCAGRRFDHVATFKHDFFAATGLYRDSDDRLAVLKIGRITPVGILPLRWIGRFLCTRETRLYQLVDDLPGVPEYIGRVGETAFLHAFVPGHPLGRDEAVSDTFFEELSSLLTEVHRRHIAYVDLNKRQNILMGDDGRPYLIDFQISLYFPPVAWRGLPPLQWLLSRFQREDRYHLLKHKRRLRPDLLTPGEQAIVERISFWIRLHRFVARPLTQLRRRILRRLKKTEDVHVAGSSAK